MGRMGDNWATAHKNWQGILAAVGLSIVLILALLLKEQEDTRTFIETTRITATITEIEITEYESRYGGENINYFTTLKLPNGKTTRFMLLQSPPAIGSNVPVSVDIYDDGSQYYHYNQMDWQLLKVQ